MMTILFFLNLNLLFSCPDQPSKLALLPRVLPLSNKVLPGDSTAKLEQLGKNAYVIIHENATDEWPHSNVGVIIGDNGVLVVDADYLPSRARADISLIRKLTSKPVKYLVYTHWHFDHNNGGIAYVDSFPRIKIITEKESQKFVELNQTYWSKMITSANSDQHKQLKKLEEELEKGTDTSGTKFSEGEIRNREKIIAQRRNELEEMSSLQVVKPNTVFQDQIEIQLGNRKVMIKDWGKANSPHDVTIYVPDEKILFTGDIVVEDPLPFVYNCWPLPWVEVLGKLETIPARKIVPGHGPVFNDFSYVKQVHVLIQHAITGVEKLIREGKTLSEIQGQLTLPGDLKEPWNKDQETIDGYKLNLQMLIERIWRGLRGQG